MTTEKALREAINTLRKDYNEYVDGVASMPFGVFRDSLAAFFDEVDAALSLPETEGEPVGHVLNEKGLWGAMMQVYLPTGTPLYAAPPSQPAQGWKLVPVEPTPEMLGAAGGWCGEKAAKEQALETWQAMLAAAPAAPTNGEGA